MELHKERGRSECWPAGGFRLESTALGMTRTRRGLNDTPVLKEQPMSQSDPKATHDYQSGQVDAVLEFLKRTRSELRSLRKVRVWTDKLHVIDINGDYFEIRSLGYPQPEIVPVLQNINTAFKKDTIHNATGEEYKEFNTGRRYTWANDRVM
jgi:hypothetical protein